MEKNATVAFERNGFYKRLKSMLQVDFRRMFKTPLFYIVVGSCFVIPVLILVMTSMMDGTVSTNPQTGEQTVIEGFKTVWQIIGTAGGGDTGAAMSMDMTTMCNINLLYFFLAVFVCVFVSDDFRSGYAKNLFAVRAEKTDYVLSKTVVCSVCGACMFVAFFVGAMLGGGVSGISFALEGANGANVMFCMLAKIFLAVVFVAIALAVSVAAKQRLWISILGSFGVGMLLFMTIPIVTPLNSTAINAVLCLVGGLAFGVGLGAVSNLVLRKTDLA